MHVRAGGSVFQGYFFGPETSGSKDGGWCIPPTSERNRKIKMLTSTHTYELDVHLEPFLCIEEVVQEGVLHPSKRPETVADGSTQKTTEQFTVDYGQQRIPLLVRHAKSF